MTTLKSYSLQKGPSEAFPLIGFSLSTERPESFLPKMERELKRKAYRGAVLIDTLACNGQTPRRFFVGEFDGDHIVYATLRILPIAEVDVATQRFCLCFYAKRPDDLEASALTSVQRFKLRREAATAASA